jgi:ketosteroid isomerase-like protein
VSQENVDKTLDFIAAYNRRDYDAALRFFHPEVDWVLPPQQQFDSARGTDGILRFFHGLDETFDELRLEPQESVDAGDRVAVRLRHHALGRGSGAELNAELYHQVTWFRDGIIVRVEYFTDWADALAAAGARAEAAD